MSGGQSSIFLNIAVPLSAPQLPPYDYRNPDPKKNIYTPQITDEDEMEMEKELRSMFGNNDKKEKKRTARTKFPDNITTEKFSIKNKSNENKKIFSVGNMLRKKRFFAEPSLGMLPIGLPPLNLSVNNLNTLLSTSSSLPASPLPSSSSSSSSSLNHLSSPTVLRLSLPFAVGKTPHLTQQQQQQQQQQRNEGLNERKITKSVSSMRKQSTSFGTTQSTLLTSNNRDNYNNYTDNSDVDNGRNVVKSSMKVIDKSINVIDNSLIDLTNEIDFEILDRLAEQSLVEREQWDELALQRK